MELFYIMVSSSVALWIICQEVIKTLKCENCPDCFVWCWIEPKIRRLAFPGHQLWTAKPNAQQQMEATPVNYDE
jgi:Pyruvate/2-oxoacid:ferredoxin oxidoreductase delta subunit